MGDGWVEDCEVQMLATGGATTCALRTSGRVICWGSGNSGKLGHGQSPSHSDPVVVHGLEDAVDVAVGASHACAVREGGGVVCWGRGNEGQLGDGASTTRATPVEVSGLDDAIGVAAGGNRSCAAQSTGGVVCWGHGTLGDGEVTGSPVPVNV